MTFRATEASKHSGKPVKLYRFMLAEAELSSLPGFEEFYFDPLTYVDVPALEVNWDIESTTPAVILTVGYPGSVAGYSPVVRFNTVASGPGEARVAHTVSGLIPGRRVLAEISYEATGHWFEELLFRIESDGSLRQVNLAAPSGSGTASGMKRTAVLTVGPSGDVKISLRLVTGYPAGVAHNDIYDVAGVRLWLEEEGGDSETPLDLEYFRTSFRRSVTYLGNVYTPCEIENTEPSQGIDDAPGTVQITLPSNDPIALELLSPIPPARPMVAIYEYHRPPVNEPSQAHVIGTLYDIGNIEDDGKQMTLTCLSLLGQGDSVVPSGLIQREQCDFGTYDPLTCGVNPAAFTYSGEVADITGLLVTVTGAAAFNPDPNFFRLGEFKKGSKSTMINGQNGDVVELDEMIPGLVVGDTVNMLAGDDRKRETCHVKYHNAHRYHGFEHMPVSNPWYGQGLRP